LFRGGLLPETLETFVREGEDINDEGVDGGLGFDACGGLFSQPTTVPITLSKPNNDHSTTDISREAAPNRGLLSRSQDVVNRSNDFEIAAPPFESPPDKDNCYVPQFADSTSQKAATPKNGQRTILLSNLSDRTTHKDLTSVVRGGKLLDIHLRIDRTAAISFVNGAHEFLAFAKRNDIYIHQKRVSVSREELFYTDAEQHTRLMPAGTIASSTFQAMLRTKLLTVLLVTSSSVPQPVK